MDEYYDGRYEYSVKPLDPAKTLEQDYYLVGSFCNWDPRKAIKFNNTVAGANIYDNPVLAVRVEITEQQAAAGYEFKVIPASSALAGNFEGAPRMHRRRDRSVWQAHRISRQGSQPGVLNVGAPMLITINIQEDSYSISCAASTYSYPPLGHHTLQAGSGNVSSHRQLQYAHSPARRFLQAHGTARRRTELIKGLLFRQNKDPGCPTR